MVGATAQCQVMAVAARSARATGRAVRSYHWVHLGYPQRSERCVVGAVTHKSAARVGWLQAALAVLDCLHSLDAALAPCATHRAVYALSVAVLLRPLGALRRACRQRLEQELDSLLHTRRTNARRSVTKYPGLALVTHQREFDREDWSLVVGALRHLPGSRCGRVRQPLSKTGITCYPRKNLKRPWKAVALAKPKQAITLIVCGGTRARPEDAQVRVCRSVCCVCVCACAYATVGHM